MSNIESQFTLDEAYHFIWCLKCLKVKHGLDLLDINPSFLRKIFGPYILNNLTRTDDDIRDAVHLWITDSDAAIEKYGHISQWDVSRVTNMNSLFRNCVSFNEDISNWDTQNVTDMSCMFNHAISFNEPIDRWNTENVTDMSYMFSLAKSFNQPIGEWNTHNVTNMSNMFSGATFFNQPIGTWNTEKVANMGGMFFAATHFQF